MTSNTKPPLLIKIGSSHWGVSFIPRLSETNDCEGQTVFSSQTINLDFGLTVDRAKEVLVHEILHVCADFVGIQDTDLLKEEEFITRLAPVLSMVLLDNPWLSNGDTEWFTTR